jgi:mannose-6-phosphate isomerase-like protein (cupin superfamily)
VPFLPDNDFCERFFTPLVKHLYGIVTETPNMARRGDVIENSTNGERITFLETGMDSGGKLLRFHQWTPKGGSIPNHIHPKQLEIIQVESGKMRLQIDGVDHILGPGDKREIQPGQKHVWWNITDGPMTFIEDTIPAMWSEVVFEQAYGLTNDGLPSTDDVIQVGATLNHFKDTLYFVAGPIWLQKYIFFPLFAFIARSQGKKPWYRKYSTDVPDNI